MGYQANRQPGQQEMQHLLNLYNSGQLAQAETTARNLLQRYPQGLMLLNVLGVTLEAQGKYAEAATSYRKALLIAPGIAEIHFNLGVVLGRLGQTEQAVASYRKALSLRPDLTVAWYNLGSLLQAQGKYDEAAAHYRKAIVQQPGFYEAHGNLGAVLQLQGRLQEAVESYRRALSIQPDALGHFNLATALRDQGDHAEAAQCYLQALQLKPDYADAHNNLGEVLRDQGDMDGALGCYQDALSIQPTHAGANYNVAEFLYLAKRYAEAQPHFERSQLGNWEERALDCLYRLERYGEFRERLQAMIDRGTRSTLLATLSNHYATNFGVADPYNHCRDPMRYAYHDRIDELAEADSPLLADLLRDINLTALARRKQGRLVQGIQSAGNLLKRPEASFQALARLIRQKVQEYRLHFAASDCDLIRDFPDEVEFSSSWYIKMKRGGHLTSHIHEEGWISGCVYLQLPTNKTHETDGAFEYGTHGDDYPQKHGNFPSHTVVQQVGDIVLFPSSLFHRTIPFDSDEERVCVAFDIKPRRFLAGVKALLLGWLTSACTFVEEFLLFPGMMLA